MLLSRETIKKRLRKVFKINKYQRIIPTLKQRYKIGLDKTIHKKSYCTDDIAKALSAMGIKTGDNVMVHCSYEEFYRYTDDPISLIDMLIELIGEEGTLFMPCYDVKPRFDARFSPSMAGLLSEIFRRKDGVIRSACMHFSIAGYGPLAEEVTNRHINSQYGFDDHSPYYKFSQLDNSKVLLFGLGKKSCFFSVLHCLDWLLKDSLPYYGKLLEAEVDGIVVDEKGIEHKKRYITRVSPCTLNHGRIKRLYSFMPKDTWSHRRLSNLDIVAYSTYEALKAGKALAYKGLPMYRKPKPHKSLFVPIDS